VDLDVELRGIIKTFEEVVAVDGIDFGVRKGEFLCLLGPSVCGKTGTLRLIA
jgi:ABC-type Fe3+/spermidine/putrescine transport system ATPase subunit